MPRQKFTGFLYPQLENVAVGSKSKFPLEPPVNRNTVDVETGGQKIDVQFRLLEVVFNKFQQPDKVIRSGGFSGGVCFQIVCKKQPEITVAAAKFGGCGCPELADG